MSAPGTSCSATSCALQSSRMSAAACQKFLPSCPMRVYRSRELRSRTCGGVSVVLGYPAVGSWGRDVWCHCPRSGSETGAVDLGAPAVNAGTPSAGSGTPAVLAEDDDNYPSVAGNRVSDVDIASGTANILDGVADNSTQTAPNDPHRVAAGLGTRDNSVRCPPYRTLPAANELSPRCN
jgi:hypothetical protein